MCTLLEKQGSISIFLCYAFGQLFVIIDICNDLYSSIVVVEARKQKQETFKE